MRNFFTLVAATTIITSCSNNAETTKKGNTPDTTKLEYAYTVAHPDEWQTGSRSNTQMVLKSLKEFENGNIEACLKDFADTVALEFDNFEAKMSKDSLLAMFKRERSGMKSFKIIMDDFESVKSKDRNIEFVSLWYKQMWQDQKGKTDSMECMDDLQIKNGKIAYLNEKIRHFPAKKM